jgi:hypothetical protein
VSNPLSDSVTGGLFVLHDHMITIVDQVGKSITTIVVPMRFILQKNAKLSHP